MKKLFPFPTLTTSEECAEHLSQVVPFTNTYVGGLSQPALSNVLQHLSTPSHRLFLGTCSAMLFAGCLFFGANAFEYGALVKQWSAWVSVIMLGLSSTVGLILFDDITAPRWYQKLYASFTKLPFEQAKNAVLNHRWDDPALHVFFDNPQRFRVLSKEEVELHHRTYTSLAPNHPCRSAWENRMKAINPLRQQDVMIMQTMMELHHQEQHHHLNTVVSLPAADAPTVEQEQLEWRQSLMSVDETVNVEQETLEIVMTDPPSSEGRQAS